MRKMRGFSGTPKEHETSRILARKVRAEHAQDMEIHIQNGQCRQAMNNLLQATAADARFDVHTDESAGSEGWARYTPEDKTQIRKLANRFADWCLREQKPKRDYPGFFGLGTRRSRRR